jgi:hypothetical protein
MNIPIEIYCSENYAFSLKKEFSDDCCMRIRAFIKMPDFSGAYSFLFSKEDILSAINNLNEVYKSLSGEIKLTDCVASNAYILIEASNTKVIIKGQLGSNSEKNFLVFEQKFDQTIIKLLYDCLNKFLNQ